MNYCITVFVTFLANSPKVEYNGIFRSSPQKNLVLVRLTLFFPVCS
jgi:hypothetical protein